MLMIVKNCTLYTEFIIVEILIVLQNVFKTYIYYH